MHSALICHPNVFGFTLDGDIEDFLLDSPQLWPDKLPFARQFMYYDLAHYLPDDLQVKLDRASMQVALEVRCPLLDFRIANLGLALKTESKYRDGLKTTLKRLLSRHVSPAVIDRPKRGFSVPLSSWLRGPMKDVVGDLLQQSVRDVSWLDATTSNRVWEEFLDGKHHYAHDVWMLFSLSHHLRQPMADPLFTSLHARSRQLRQSAA